MRLRYRWLYVSRAGFFGAVNCPSTGKVSCALQRGTLECELLERRRFKTQAEARIAKRDKGHEIAKAGIYQASQWIENQFPNPAEPKAYLQKRRPDVYKELFPGETGEVKFDPTGPVRCIPGAVAAG